MQTVRKRKKKRIEWIDVVCYGFVILVVIVTLYPVLHLMALSLSSSKAVSKNAVSIWPIGLNFQAYKQVMATGTVPKSFVNSIIYTFIGTVINMLLTSTMAYALSKKRLPSAISTYNLIVLRSFFAAMPEELEESANLDGANDLIVFWKIVLPLSKAGLATVALFYLVGHWNSFYSAMIYLQDVDKYPLQLILRNIVIQGQMASELAAAGQSAVAEELYGKVSVNSIKYATLFISIVPMMIIYPFIQKYFVKGVYDRISEGITQRAWTRRRKNEINSWKNCLQSAMQRIK